MSAGQPIQNPVQYLPTSKLRHHERNPRFIKDRDFEILCESIQANPDYFETRPILCNPEHRVFAGNMRLRAAKQLGLKSVPVVVMDIPEERQRELMIRDNVANGQWQTDVLAADFEMEELQGWGMPDFVFGVDGEAGEAEVLEAQDDDFEVPEPSTVQTDIVLGDLIEIGRHRLLCGSSTEADAVAKLLNGATPNLMVTDPPYGVNYDPAWREDLEHQRKGTANGKAIKNDHTANWRDAYALFPGQVAYVWHASSKTIQFGRDLQDCDFDLLYLIVWNKDLHVLSRGDYHWKHEVCWYGVKRGADHNWQGSRKEMTVWDIPTIHSFKNGHNKEDWDLQGHGNQKPVDCMARPIRNNSAEGEVVYDAFTGSGTTMVAAHQLNRTCYGMELDPKYCQVIIDRMAKLDPTLPIKINGKPYTKAREKQGT